jgi:glutathione S-transferase
MLKIWGRINSINVQKVLWACEELGIPYERIDAGMQFGVVNTPEYKKHLNPNALVPAIDDDGFVLWESNAIVRYLAAKHGAGTLWHDDLQLRASADRWMDWQQTALWGRGLRDVFWTLIRTPAEKRDLKAHQAALARTTDNVQILESALAGGDYVCGETFGMADIPVGCAIHRWFGVPIERPATPRLEAYYRRLSARPAYRKIVLHPLS